jgi:uncharacterized membrane protein
LAELNAASARGHIGVPATIAALATVALVPFLGKSLWTDEGASLYSARLSWSGLWRQSEVVDRVYVLYYSFLHLWIHVNGTIEWLRAPSLLAYGLTVYLVGRIGIRFGGVWCGALAAVLTATSPLMVIAALDARPYALATLFATISVWALLRWFQEGHARWAWLFCAATIVTLLLQLFSVLVPLVVVAVALCLGPSSFRSRWRTLLAPVGLALLAAVVFATVVAGQRAQVDWIAPLTLRGLPYDLVTTVSGNLVPGLAPVYFVVVCLISITALVNLIWTWRRGTTHLERHALEMLTIAIAWAMSMTIGLLVLSLVTPVFYSRYLTAAVPGVAIFVGTLTVLSFHSMSTSREFRTRRLVAGATYTLVALVLVANSLSVAGKVYEDFKGAANYLAAHVGPNGEVALRSHGLSTGIEYYLSSASTPVTTWPESRSEEQILGLDLDEGLRVMARGRQNVWVVDVASTTGLGSFNAALKRNGYVIVGSTTIGTVRPVIVVHFRREHKASG